MILLKEIFHRRCKSNDSENGSYHWTRAERNLKSNQSHFLVRICILKENLHITHFVPTSHHWSLNNISFWHCVLLFRWCASRRRSHKRPLLLGSHHAMMAVRPTTTTATRTREDQWSTLSFRLVQLDSLVYFFKYLCVKKQCTVTTTPSWHSCVPHDIQQRCVRWHPYEKWRVGLRVALAWFFVIQFAFPLTLDLYH